MNYKNSSTGEVISQECYNKLPYLKKQGHIATSQSVTHSVDEDDDSGDFLLNTLIASELGSLLSDSTSDNSFSSDNGSLDSSSSFGDFGGGDGGGGGATGDW